MKKIVVAMAIILFVLAGCQETAQVDGKALTYEEIQKKIEVAEKKLEELNSEVITVTDRLEKNQAKSDELEKLVTDHEKLKNDIIKAESTLVDLETNIIEATEKLKTLNEQVEQPEVLKLEAGHYIFGSDIHPGRYEAAAIGEGSVLIVRDPGGNRTVYTFLKGNEAKQGYGFDAQSGYTLVAEGSIQLTSVE